jgi:hypothetical protein
MNLDQFREAHTASPISLEDFAQLVLDDLDEGDGAEGDTLISEAVGFLEAKKLLEGAMTEADVELG